MKAYVLIKIQTGEIVDAIHQLRKVPGVVTADMTFGLYDAVAIVEASGNRLCRSVSCPVCTVSFCEYFGGTLDSIGPQPRINTPSVSASTVRTVLKSRVRLSVRLAQVFILNKGRQGADSPCLPFSMTVFTGLSQILQSPREPPLAGQLARGTASNSRS